MSAANYQSILDLAGSLTREEKLRLIRELSARTASTEEEAGAGNDRSILELSGLGAEIWNGLDAQEYVSNERASWNG